MVGVLLLVLWFRLLFFCGTSSYYLFLVRWFVCWCWVLVFDFVWVMYCGVLVLGVVFFGTLIGFVWVCYGCYCLLSLLLVFTVCLCCFVELLC